MTDPTFSTDDLLIVARWLAVQIEAGDRHIALLPRNAVDEQTALMYTKLVHLTDVATVRAQVAGLREYEVARDIAAADRGLV